MVCAVQRCVRKHARTRGPEYLRPLSIIFHGGPPLFPHSVQGERLEYFRLRCVCGVRGGDQEVSAVADPGGSGAFVKEKSSLAVPMVH